MKKIYLLFSFILCAGFLQAQDAKSLFKKMPDSLLPLLTEVNRADFIDFLDSNMKAEVKNKMEGTSEMTALTGDYIYIRTTEHSSWEMKILTMADGKKIICTITTSCAPVCDSRMAFFSSEWQSLPESTYITLPVKDDFFRRPEASELYDYGMLMEKADMSLIKAGLSEEDNSLTFTFTTPEYMVKEDAEKLEKFMHTLRYQWDGQRFKRMS